MNRRQALAVTAVATLAPAALRAAELPAEGPDGPLVRISTDETDVGFTWSCIGCRVLVDGAVDDQVVTADERLGYVIRIDKSAPGLLALRRGTVRVLDFDHARAAHAEALLHRRAMDPMPAPPSELIEAVRMDNGDVYKALRTARHG